ncbi:hypothetical protein M0804_006356 [Polistes exclamans]|nr:hypothetical protein M0804_006356 [Polistes exclamans]
MTGLLTLTRRNFCSKTDKPNAAVSSDGGGGGDGGLYEDREASMHVGRVTMKQQVAAAPEFYDRLCNLDGPCNPPFSALYTHWALYGVAIYIRARVRESEEEEFRKRRKRRESCGGGRGGGVGGEERRGRRVTGIAAAAAAGAEEEEDEEEEEEEDQQVLG